MTKGKVKCGFGQRLTWQVACRERKHKLGDKTVKIRLDMGKETDRVRDSRLNSW